MVRSAHCGTATPGDRRCVLRRSARPRQLVHTGTRAAKTGYPAAPGDRTQAPRGRGGRGGVAKREASCDGASSKDRFKALPRSCSPKPVRCSASQSIGAPLLTAEAPNTAFPGSMACPCVRLRRTLTLSRQPSTAPADVVHRDFGLKQAGTSGGWKHRYFVLANRRLEYFDEPGGERKGILSLHPFAYVCKRCEAGLQAGGPSEERVPLSADSSSSCPALLLFLHPSTAQSPTAVCACSHRTACCTFAARRHTPRSAGARR